MIKKASSSEIFDIYAARMISKRAASIPSQVAKEAEELIGIFGGFAKKIIGELPRQQLDDAITTGTVIPRHISPIKALSSTTDAALISEKFENLVYASHIDEGAREILAAARNAGYQETKVRDFLKIYASDFSDMANEYEKLSSGTPSTTDIAEFVNKYKKEIVFFNEVKNSQFLNNKELISAGEKMAKSGRTYVPLDEAKKAPDVPDVPKNKDPARGEKSKELQQAELEHQRAQTAEIYSKIHNKSVEGVGSLIGGGIAGAGVVLKLAFWGAVVVGGIKLYNMIKGDLPGAVRESEEHFQKLIDAKGCIDSIELKPGSPAVEQRELIKENLDKVLKIEWLGNNAQRFEQATEQEKATAQAILEEGGTAANELVGNGKGSLAGFVAMISQNPQANFDDFLAGNKYTSTAAGAAAGATAGYMMSSKPLIGAAIGGVLGGLGGYKFLGDYYDDEVTCLLTAGDALKVINDKLQAATGVGSGGSESAGTEASTGSSQGGESSGGSEMQSSDSDFLERLLSVASTQKLGGLPGIDVTNEKELTGSYIAACGGVKNTATILLQKNANIRSYIESIRNNYPALLTAPIDSKIVKNKAIDKLLESIYSTMQSTVKNANRSKISLRDQLATEGFIISKSGKNNLNKMNKTSKSINNQELIRKAAETRVSYFGDANLGLKEQLTKSYYSGLTDMYNEKPQKRSSDYKDLYPQEETGEDLILQAHPKSITLADAMGKGGLVENGLEAKEKSTYVALKTPSGNFQSKYASTIGYLQKLAKAADAQGKKEVSKLINQTIQNLK